MFHSRPMIRLRRCLTEAKIMAINPSILPKKLVPSVKRRKLNTIRNTRTQIRLITGIIVDVTIIAISTGLGSIANSSKSSWYPRLLLARILCGAHTLPRPRWKLLCSLHRLGECPMTDSPLDSRIKNIIRVSSGNFLEMYDFIVFGYYAAAIGRTFFPGESPFASLMLSLMTFGAGFLMRPIGAIVLGAYIDRYG
jgi:hypothetical protein